MCIRDRFVLISLTFFMMRMLPGNPFIGDKTVSATAMANMNAKYGLDKPVFVQYLMYMGNCLRGDLGISITYNRDVMTIISESFLVSADLGIRAIIFAVIIGILLGAVAAIKRGSVWDSVSTVSYTHLDGACCGGKRAVRRDSGFLRLRPEL